MAHAVGGRRREETAVLRPTLGRGFLSLQKYQPTLGQDF